MITKPQMAGLRLFAMVVCQPMTFAQQADGARCAADPRILSVPQGFLSQDLSEAPASITVSYP